jgi:Tol biopolymer transport system component
VETTGVFSAELASEVGMWAAPQFSPNGETLLFGRARIPYQSHLSSYTLCTMDRDGSNSRCHYPPEDETGIEIPVWRWSPDSASVAFIFRDDLHVLNFAEALPIPVTDEGGVTAVDWR